MTKAGIAADSPALYPAARPTVLAVYGAALLQGMTLVSFPAVSAELKQALGLTDAGYGALFLPQVALAIAGALAGGALAKSRGLKALLAMALVANGVSQLLLAASAYASPAGGFALLFAGTSSLGFGFGLIGGPINAFPALLFPRRAEMAIVVAHTLLGLGLAIGPLIAGLFATAGAWTAFPALLAGACMAGALSTLLVMLPNPAPATGDEPVSKLPYASTAYWLFVAITVIYAFAEGTFSNWGVIFLRDVKGLPGMKASFALSAFWGMLVAGRLLVSLLILRIPLRFIWIALPVLMIAAFWLVPQANGAAAGIGAFALAGLACSAFLPLTISLAAARFPANVAWVSSMLIAALMTGVGVGSWLTGALQARLPLDTLYRLSSIYPLLVLALTWLILKRANRESQAMSPAPNFIMHKELDGGFFPKLALPARSPQSDPKEA
jgi:predicted MFS family arabinose efflux permease